VTDRRQKVVFHTLRHTFASWLVQMGRPLYTVSKLLGHRNIRWTERYAHLDPEVQREATLGLEGILTGLTR
jgi:site-specific recombinase XerD